MIFRNFVLQNFPFLEDDFDALTDYELFCKMVEYMKKSLDKVNEYKTELNEFRAELDSYKNYFDNLDVQEEIDNKLDEMAESGELTDIIAQYLQLAGVLAYNTVADMSDADNLVNGSICKCLGYLSYNDGKGCFYKVRTVTVSDVVDGFNIVALDVSNTLIAERMVGYYDIVKKENSANMYDIPTIMIGDSYACGESAGTTIDGWCDRLKTLLNLSDENYHKIALSGYGFITTPNFLDGLQANDDNIDRESIKSIIVCGGYNDARIWDDSTSAALLRQNLDDFSDYCHTYYPNAKIYIGMISNTSDKTSTGKRIRKLLNNLILTMYQIGADTSDGNTIYLNGVENLLKYYTLISSDTIHPNEYGYHNLAKWIYKAYTSGYCETFSDYEQMTITSNESNPFDTISHNIQVALHNQTLTINSDAQIEITFSSAIEFNQNNMILGNYSSSFMIPNIDIVFPVKFYTDDNNSTSSGNYFYGNVGLLKFTDNMVLLDLQTINPTTNRGWIDGTVVKILRIKPFTHETSIRNI